MSRQLKRIKRKRIDSYFNKGIIVDTGPLILLLAGNYNVDVIGKTKLTKGYDVEDYEILFKFISKFGAIIVTPQTLAEVSNIINTKEPSNNFENFLRKTINILSDSKEVYVKKDIILSSNEVFKLGITDSSILLCSERYDKVILTKDLKLSLLCRSKGIPVVHFDELRDEIWSSM